jgi:hypothetical protein
MPSEPKGDVLRVDEATRDALALQFREWIHEQPFSICAKTNMDTCPDWPLAYEMADIARRCIESRFPVSAEPSPDGYAKVEGGDGEAHKSVITQSEPSPDALRVALERIRDHGQTHDEPCWALHQGDCAEVMQELARAALAASPPAEPTLNYRATNGPIKWYHRATFAEAHADLGEAGDDAWVERRTTPGTWERVPAPDPCPWCQGTGRHEYPAQRETCPGCGGTGQRVPDEGRVEDGGEG